MLIGIQRIHRRQPPSRVRRHGHQHPLEPLDQRLDASRVEQVGVVLDAKRRFVAGLRLHRQRIVGRFPGGDIGDVQLSSIRAARQRLGVDRVVLVGEKRVE
jgi:hypothetical protein